MEFFLRQVYPWLVDISSLCSLLPLVVGLLLIRKNRSLLFRLLFTYVVLLVSSDAAGHLLVYLGSNNNIWAIHIFTLLEFLVLAAIYYHSFNLPVIKKGILLAVVCFVLVSAADAFVIESIMQMNSVAKVVQSSLLILLAILYFYKVANDLSITYLDRDPVFLLSCGILIYKAGTTMSFAMFNTALAWSYDAARICITILLVLNILFFAFLMLVLKRATA